MPASNIEEHAATGPGALRLPHTGRIAVFVLGVILLGAVFGSYGFPRPNVFGLGAMIVLEVIYYLWKRRRAARLRAKAVSLQRELHDLKQADFNFRYEQAKKAGTLDRFEGDTDGD